MILRLESLSFFLLYHLHILSLFEVGDDLDDFFRDVIAYVREVLAGADGFEEGEKLVAQTFAI